ncbi:GDNF family receptor alpha-like [Discoglossus pictus]
MPYNIAHMLAFCDCTQSDEDCERTGNILHSKPCATHKDPPTSCDKVIQSCLEDELCKQRYETFKSKCWAHTTLCNNDENCFFGVSQEDLICSGNDDCKAAYIGILGTKLQMQCTCSTSVNHEKHHLCNLFYHMLHSKSCLKKVTPRNIHASYSDTQEKKLITEPVTEHHTLQLGGVIHIIAYTSGIILSSGIIILALLQTRACRTQKKGKLPKGNASDSLMVS